MHNAVCILFASMCMLLWIHGDSICVMFSGGRLGSPRPCIHPHPPPALPPQDLCFLVHVVVDGLQVNRRCIVLSASSPFLSPHPPPPYPQTHTSICMLWWMVCKWIPGALCCLHPFCFHVHVIVDPWRFHLCNVFWWSPRVTSPLHPPPPPTCPSTPRLVLPCALYGGWCANGVAGWVHPHLYPQIHKHQCVCILQLK